MNKKQEVSIITRQTLRDGFLACGLHKGDIVEVHASLKAIGYLVGGPQIVIDALVDVIGIEGTIVMAAQAYDNSEPAFFENPPIPVQDYDRFRKSRPAYRGKLENIRPMGELARALLSRPNSYLSDHPRDAFIAMGKYAKWITQNHPLSSELGPDSPLGKMLELKSKILLIGVDYDNATGMHLGEHLSGKREHILQGARIVIHGESHWVKFNATDYDSNVFVEPGKRLEEKGLVKFGQIGSAKVKLYTLEAATEVTKAYFEEVL